MKGLPTGRIGTRWDRCYWWRSGLDAEACSGLESEALAEERDSVTHLSKIGLDMSQIWVRRMIVCP